MKQAKIKALLNNFGASIFLHLLPLLILGIFLCDKKESPTPFETSSATTSAPKLSTSSKIEAQKEAEKPLKNDQRPSNQEIDSATSIQNTYVNQLREIISSHQNYPILAQKRGLVGIVVVKIEIGVQGELISVEHVLKPFSAQISPILVESALHSVKNSTPFPPPPAGISRIFEIPIHYKISQ